MRRIAYIVVASVIPIAATAGDWFYVVDVARSVTNGPFQLRDGEEIRIAKKRYQITRASPLYDLDKVKVAEFDAREESPEAAFSKAWSNVNTHAKSPLPELFVWKTKTNETISLALVQTDLAHVIEYVCEIASLEVARHKSGYYYQPRDILIIQPRGARAGYETQAYFMMPEMYDSITHDGLTIKDFLHKLGVLEQEDDADIEYDRERGWLLLRAPQEVHERFHRCI